MPDGDDASQATPSPAQVRYTALAPADAVQPPSSGTSQEGASELAGGVGTHGGAFEVRRREPGHQHGKGRLEQHEGGEEGHHQSQISTVKLSGDAAEPRLGDGQHYDGAEKHGPGLPTAVGKPHERHHQHHGGHQHTQVHAAMARALAWVRRPWTLSAQVLRQQ